MENPTVAADAAAAPQGNNAGAATAMKPEDVAYDSGFRAGHHDGEEAGVVRERLRMLRAQLRTSIVQQIATAIGVLIPTIAENDDDLFGDDTPAPETKAETAAGFWEKFAETLPGLVEKIRTQSQSRNATPAEVMQARYGHVVDLLKRYGEHTDDCPSPGKPCTCGWEEIATSLEPPAPAEPGAAAAPVDPTPAEPTPTA